MDLNDSLGRCAEYAYHLLPRYWHLGLMSEATRAAFEWVREIGCVELEAFIDLANTASVRFAERNGLLRSGESANGAARFVRTLADSD